MSDKRDTTPPHFASFEDFWPHYVRAHANRTSRRLHFIGTTLAMGCVGGAALFRRPSLLLAAPVLGYGFAWVGHFVFEKNIPATFGHPVWSFRADMLMWSKIANGTMDAEVERYAGADAATAEPSHDDVANGVRASATAN